MKAYYLTSLGLLGISLSALLSHSAAAYRHMRSGAIVCLLVLFVGPLILSFVGATAARFKLGYATRPSDLSYGASFGVFALFLLLVGVGIGMFTGIGGMR